MFKLKYFINFVVLVGLVAVGANKYSSKLLEDRVLLSMENHNKKGEVIFKGEPAINVALGSFAIKDISVVGADGKLNFNGDLKVHGVDYYNYFLNDKLFSDTVILDLIILDLKNIKDEKSNKTASNLIVISKEGDGINIDYKLESSYVDSQTKIDQRLEFFFDNIPTTYDSLNKELSLLFMKKEDFNSSNIVNIISKDKGTASIGKIKYSMVNNGFINEILSENQTIEDTKKLKEGILKQLNYNIDKYNLESLNPNIREIASRVITENNSKLSLEVKAKTKTSVKNLIMSSIVSGNITNTLKNNYDLKLE